MSARIELVITCNGCQARLYSGSECGSAGGWKALQMRAGTIYQTDGVVTINQPMRQTRHYCRACADSAPQKK